MVRRVPWVMTDEMYPVYRLYTDIPDLPDGLVERYEHAMDVFFTMQHELRQFYFERKSSLEWRDGPRKVDHPAVPDDSIPLPYEEYDQ